MDKLYRVLIIGCGQLGSRHLQAVALIPQVSEIEIVDSRPEGLDLGRQRLAEISDSNPKARFRWLSSLDKAGKGGDLCIVATQADVRCELVYEIAKTLGYSSFLVEKIVAQSSREYEELMDFAAARGLSVWVNCKQRAEPLNKHIKGKIDQSEPIAFSVVGGNHGLATNGIHIADLFTFFDGTSHIYGAGSVIEKVVYPSKRGPHLFDLSGTLCGYSRKGSHFVLSYFPCGKSPDHLSVVTSSIRWIVDRQLRWAWESEAASAWQWQPLPFEGNLNVSNMTRVFAGDILSKGECELPTLVECYPAHRFILNELQPHFSKLMGAEVERCPVT